MAVWVTPEGTLKLTVTAVFAEKMILTVQSLEALTVKVLPFWVTVALPEVT